ncbi:hypothetical protein VNI00_004377 [Paramarasmius palmivorus]|uniref:Zn(2)-C6 fungal-type domain-containing protein n=1 Tax=Paramarasmius palmivorus TaxID=297713 RepID=A0AAW0DQ91_9AGAR
MKRRKITTTSTAPGSRRTRSVAACNACRKLKTRCELLELDTQCIQCHRCKTLGLRCSYQDMDKTLFEPQEDSRSNSWEQVINLNAEAPAQAVEERVGIVQQQEKRVERARENCTRDWQFFGQENEDHDEENGPLAAIQGLIDNCYSRTSRPSDPPKPSPLLAHQTLESILTKDQTIHLLGLFDQKHAPWLNFDLIRSEPTPTLDLVCCAIAARHLTQELRDAISPNLQLASDEAISKLIFRPRSSGSLETIQALLIIAFWAPISGSTEETRDGHLLLASSISMALNLRLNECPDKLLEARRTSSLDGKALDDLTNKAKLWLALANADSLLSIGRGKTSLSTRGDAYNKLFPLPVGVPTGRSERQELRLRLLGDVLDGCEMGLNHHLASSDPETFEKWYEHACDILRLSIPVERICKPLIGQLLSLTATQTCADLHKLPVLSGFDKSQFYATIIVARTCHVLLVYHWRFIRRTTFNASGSRPLNYSNAAHWGREAMVASEATLLALIEMDHHLLAPMPDFVFNYITFLAAFAVGVKFIFWNAMRKELPGLADELLSKVVDVLRSAGCLPDHPASKCAEVIHGLLNLWLHKEMVSAHALANSPSTSAVAEAVRTSAAPETSLPISTPTSSDFETPAEPYLFPPPEMQQSAADMDFGWFNESLMQEFTSWGGNGFTQESYMGYSMIMLLYWTISSMIQI